VAGQVAPVAWQVELLDWSQAATRALPLRIAVFVDEQGVPADIEHDDWDARSVQAIARDAVGSVVGTGRLLPDGHIGRMAVARGARGRGVGSALLRALLNDAARRGHRHVLLHAQRDAARFYTSHGFRVSGAEFLEAGIVHLPMSRPVSAIGSPGMGPGPAN
jgi:predicted GNAT family N-acyltransferase